MDAGIIAAFKRHYRKSQLQHAIDMIDVGESNSYKIDQFKAMQWSRMIWRNMNSSVLANCWRYTILLTKDAIITIDINDITAESVKRDDFDIEFIILLQSLNIQSSDALTLDEYLNISEEEEAHEFLTDEQLIESAQTVEEDKEQEAAIKRSEFVLSKYD